MDTNKIAKNKLYKPGLLRDVDKLLASTLSDEEKIRLTVSGYSRIADEWDKTRVNLWPELMLAMDEYIIKSGKLLDLGCGNGRLIDSLFKIRDIKSLSYTGVDPSEELIKIAIAKHTEFRLETFNGQHLANFSDWQFDQVISIAVMHHLPPNKILGWLLEARRVTRIGSVSIFTTWNLSKSNYDLNENGDAVIGFTTHQNTRYVHNYQEAEVREVFAMTGYEVLKIEEVSRESGMTNILIVAKSI